MRCRCVDVLYIVLTHGTRKRGCTLHCPHPWNTQAWMYFTLSSPMEHASVDVLYIVLTHGTRKRGCTLHCPHPWNTQAWMYFTLSSPMEHASVDVLYIVLTHGTGKTQQATANELCAQFCMHHHHVVLFSNFPKHTHTHTRAHPRTHTHTHARTHTLTACTHTHTLMHVHTHAHTQCIQIHIYLNTVKDWLPYFVQTASSLSILYYTWIYTPHLIHNLFCFCFVFFLFLSTQQISLHTCLHVHHNLHKVQFHTYRHNVAKQCTHTRKEKGGLGHAQLPPPPFTPQNTFSSSKYLPNNILIYNQYIQGEKK